MTFTLPSVDQLIGLGPYNQIMGTPSAQTIFQFLACWKTLTLREIILKSGLEDNQVKETLENLEKIGIVNKTQKGAYTVKKSVFVQKLQDTYLIHLERAIGNALYEFTKLLDTVEPSELSPKFEKIVQQWEPLLQQKFASKMNSLAQYFYNHQLQEHQ
jgi:DNA-binding transcriptional regulator YhcF (GntR family)